MDVTSGRAGARSCGRNGLARVTRMRVAGARRACTGVGRGGGRRCAVVVGYQQAGEDSRARTDDTGGASRTGGTSLRVIVRPVAVVGVSVDVVVVWVRGIGDGGREVVDVAVWWRVVCFAAVVCERAVRREPVVPVETEGVDGADRPLARGDGLARRPRRSTRVSGALGRRLVTGRAPRAGVARAVASERRSRPADGKRSCATPRGGAGIQATIDADRA